MALPTASIQTGFITRLRASTDLRSALVGSISPEWSMYDQGGVPTNQAFPYVAIFPITSGSGTALAMRTDAVDTYVQVSIFTQSGGFAQARNIAKIIYSLLQKQAFDLSGDGFNQFFLLFDYEQELMQADGITQMIVHRYKLMTTG